MRIDATDAAILEILRRNATTPKAEIAREVGLASSAVFARIARLEKAGLLRGYRAVLDAAKLGFPILAFVLIHESKPVRGESTLAALVRLELAEELHRITGEDCYLLKVRARDTDDLRRKLDRIGEVESISSVRTHLVLQSAAGADLEIASAE